MLEKKVRAHLVLEDGTVFEGKAFGYLKETVGNVVFFTNSASYQEILTDPACNGNIIVLTHPLIGNYGINLDDSESDDAKVRGLVVRECTDFPNNWRFEMELGDFLRQNKIVAIQGIDTRELTKHIRNNGSMKGIITLRYSELSEAQKAQKFSVDSYVDLSDNSGEINTIYGKAPHVCIIDMDMTNSMLKEFKQRGVTLTTVPYKKATEEVLSKIDSDCVFISNGPGLAQDYEQIIALTKKLSENTAVFGCGLGHNIIASALGCKIEKHKYGHHGSNYPVKELATGKVYVTKQIQSQYVSELSDCVEKTYVNVVEGIVEGIKHKEKPIESVKFIPETDITNHNSGHFIDRIIKTTEGGKRNA